jgi:hypothetical protein
VFEHRPYFCVEHMPNGSPVVLAFSVTLDKYSGVAVTKASERFDYGRAAANTSDEVVLCRDFYEALLVESAGFTAVSYGTNSPEQLDKRLPGHLRNQKPWTGKRVLVGWGRNEGAHKDGLLSFIGAKWAYMSPALGDLTPVSPTVLKDIIESDFRRMG